MQWPQWGARVTRGDNVVAFTPPDGRRKGPNPKQLIEAVRDSAEQQLAALLEGLFDNTDDTLFELADRSDRNAEQHRYIDAMRDIRLKRLRIMRGFKKAYRNQFKRLLDADALQSTFPDGVDDHERENLALVENDELEVSVAISGMVSKAQSQHSMALFAVSARLDSLLDSVEIDESNNPLGPRKLSESFGRAADQLEVDIRIRLILFKLFERHVLAKLAPIYESVDAILTGAGVLPDVRNLRRRTERSRSTEGSAPPRAAGPRSQAPMGGTQMDFDGLRQLMHSSHPSPARAQGPMVSTQEFMGALSQVQASASAMPLDPLATPSMVDFDELVASQQGQLTRPDEDAVNLIGMLFNFILNDHNLAIPMKALIGRLQIPLLKVALMDHVFFSQSDHPARQLLNELSSAGIGWSAGGELRRDALYEKVESIVERILNQFEQDVSLLEALLAELREFIARDRRKTQMVEQRLRESETGRAKTDDARREVRQRVGRKMGGLRMPQSVAEFIHNVWQRVLIHVHVRESTESQTWHQMLQALDDLLWCVQTLTAEDDRLFRRNLRVELEANLRKGLARVTQDQQTTERELALVTTPLDLIIERDDAASKRHDPASTSKEDASTEDSVATEEIEVPMSEPESVSTQELVDPAFVAQAKDLSEGSWVEYRDGSGLSQRCKLVGIVTPGERYVFANRRGMKVAAMTCDDVAARIANDEITLLDDSALFERALSSVITELRAQSAGR